MQQADYGQALEAARRWMAKYARPASWWEWEAAEPGRPIAKAISRRWGWHAFWAEVTATRPDQLYPRTDRVKPAADRLLLVWSSEEML